MLAEPDLDVVAVCSYHRLHKDQVLAAARAGKHVICEKPLALTLADLREIQQRGPRGGRATLRVFRAALRRPVPCHQVGDRSRAARAAALRRGGLLSRHRTLVPRLRLVPDGPGGSQHSALGRLPCRGHLPDVHGRRRGGSVLLQHEVSQPGVRSVRVSVDQRRRAEIS